MSEDLATKDLKKRIRKIAVILIIAVLILSGAVLFALIKNGISLYAVSGDSMEPTFSDKDSLIISQERNVSKNQIVFFEKPEKWDNYADNDITLVKRIAAVPGDTLRYQDGIFTVNGDEVYNIEENNYECQNGTSNYEHTLTNRELFVLGDNAQVSLDSRRIFCDGDEKDMFVPRNSIKNYGEVVFKF